MRREIETAYELGVQVVPVGLEGAMTPSSEVLPERLGPLNRANAQDLGSPRDFDSRVERLIAQLDRQLST